ncbi:hypothetical protein TL16_g00271 [Triparma laevis f. inornata]|uniref:EF-hand domain-containing protein n=2 Tax=Triparma laevis TaxID=1534972 RepID=A0A9W7FSY0_9STRA|nr:hypothetical protein TL16_g00271 [Triparma laevis f. inornata]GMI17668.1 hypothetical protein TrLO_g10543 [Triparma laevis f. longispina]
MKTTWFMNLMQQVSASRIFSERKKIELYPPFFMMRITVLQLKNQWRSVKVKLPLNIFSRNPGGVMFGGYQAALADPIAALACSRIFPGHSCWTRAMTIDFKLGGSTDLELRFEFPPELEEQIRQDLETKGRSTPTFLYGYYLKDGTLCTSISNTVAIRPKGYIGATTPPAAEEFATPLSIEKVESLVRERVIKELATHKNERALEQLWGSMGGGKGMDREMFGSVLEDLGMGGKFQSEEIDTLFNALDRDGSGKISLDEVEDFVQMKRKGEANK